MIRVFDASAMIAFLRGEPGSDVVLAILKDPASRSAAHAINLCEVYYHFIHYSDEKTAKAAIADIRTAGIQVRRDLSAKFWMRVGQVKGTILRVSLADCFAITLSLHLNGDVVTSDHHEFDSLVQQGIFRAHFIR